MNKYAVLLLSLSLVMAFSGVALATDRVETLFSHSEYNCFQMPQELGGEFVKIRAIYNKERLGGMEVLNSLIDLDMMEGEDILLNASTTFLEPSRNENPNLMKISIALDNEVLLNNWGMVENLIFVASPRVVQGALKSDMNREMEIRSGISPRTPRLRAYAKTKLIFDIPAQKCPN